MTVALKFRSSLTGFLVGQQLGVFERVRPEVLSEMADLGEDLVSYCEKEGERANIDLKIMVKEFQPR